MSGHRWSRPIWQQLASSTQWTEGTDASRNGRELPAGYLRLYALFDPETYDVRYVGLTSRLLVERLAAHVKDARTSDSHKARWMRSINGEPLIVELMQLEEPLALAAEQAMIWSLKSIGCPLTNVHAGGGGFDSHAPDALQRASVGIKDAWRRGAYEHVDRSAASKTAWDTRRERLEAGELAPQVAWNKGRTWSEEERQAISDGCMKGKRPQPELVQIVADHAGLTYIQVYRSLKGKAGKKIKPPAAVIEQAWKAYDELNERNEIDGLSVNEDSRL